MEAVGKKEWPATIRVYSWKPWAVSVGYAQNIASEFDTEKLKENGIDIVRRMTGGRAVLHSEEMTYSVIARTDTIGIGKNLYETYNIVGKAVLEALRQAGFGSLELQKMKSVDDSLKPEITPPCFSSSARYEIVWGGRKIVGSAQKRSRNVLLQQGSILLGDAYLKIVNFMRLGMTEKKEYCDSLRKNSVSLSEIAGRSVDYAEINGKFCAGFETVFDIAVKENKLPDFIIARAKELTESKYSTKEWNFRP